MDNTIPYAIPLVAVQVVPVGRRRTRRIPTEAERAAAVRRRRYRHIAVATIASATTTALSATLYYLGNTVDVSREIRYAFNVFGTCFAAGSLAALSEIATQLYRHCRNR